MNLFLEFVDYFSFLWVRMIAGMFLFRRQFEKEFASNPRLNVEAVRTLLGASGQRPSEAKVNKSIIIEPTKISLAKNKKNKSGAISQ